MERKCGRGGSGDSRSQQFRKRRKLVQEWLISVQQRPAVSDTAMEEYESSSSDPPCSSDAAGSVTSSDTELEYTASTYEQSTINQPHFESKSDAGLLVESIGNATPMEYADTGLLHGVDQGIIPSHTDIHVHESSSADDVVQGAGQGSDCCSDQEELNSDDSFDVYMSEDYYSPDTDLVSSSADDEQSLSESACSDVENEGDEQLILQIATWAVDSKMPHKHLRGLLAILNQHFPALPKDPRTLLRTVKDYEILNISGGKYYHFGIAKGIVSFSAQLADHARDIDAHGGLIIRVQVNIDGLPLFKSSNTQFWPILVRIVEPIKTEPFIVGLFCGKSKPSDVSEFLDDFVTELKQIDQHGIDIDEVGKISLNISCFICDAPARAFVKQTKAHNAYWGCEKYAQKGQWRNKVIMTEVNADLRTDITFDEMTQPEHHIGTSPLSGLCGMVTQFPLVPMHLVCLGVMKRLIWCWLKGPLVAGCRVGANMASNISAGLLACRRYIPRAFNRKCRSLMEFERWKATEFRQFALYSGIVVLRQNLNDGYYDHYLHFAVAIFCLSSPLLLRTVRSEYADKLLKMFITDWQKYYGIETQTYNIHSLSHLAADAERFGPLDTFSAFPFENYLGRLKKIVRKPSQPLAQVIRRLSEIKFVGPAQTIKDSGLFKVTHEHSNGPTLARNSSLSQYEWLVYEGNDFSLKDSDSCVRVGRHFGLIKNIYLDQRNDGSEPFILFEPFTTVRDFFTEPVKSSDIGIVRVGAHTGGLRVEQISDIAGKYVRLPYKDDFVLIPLHHSLH